MHANSQCEPRLCGAGLQCIYDFVEHVKIDIVGATVEKGRILFETVKVKIFEELLLYHFRK